MYRKILNRKNKTNPIGIAQKKCVQVYIAKVVW